MSYTYNSPLQNAGPFLADLNGKNSQFTLNAGVLINLDGTSPTTTFTIEAAVTNFRLNLLPSFQFVIIGFDKASFTSVNGAAPTVHCPFNANNVQLVGPLDFVSDLTAALDLPPELVVQLIGLTLTVGLNLTLPDIPCGAFDMVGLSVYTAVKLEFSGRSAAHHLWLCKSESTLPSCLSVSRRGRIYKSGVLPDARYNRYGSHRCA